MDRKTIADIFDSCGTLLELKGENPFRCNAYFNASRAIQQMEGDLRELDAAGKLKSVKGIGSAIADKIRELLTTGRLEFYEKLRAEIPVGLVDMLRINGLGPKRIKQVHDELGVDSVEALKAACLAGSVAKLKGFGDKSVDRILSAISFLDKTGKRVLYPVARRLADRILDRLAGHPLVQKIEVCGSLRRGSPTIKDIDILVASDDAEPIMRQFVDSPDVVQVVGQGPTKSSVLLETGVPADLRVVPQKAFPFALHYFTGSKEHNVAMRARAQARDLKLNEYELAGPKRSVACETEADIFAALGLAYIEPELREDTGECDAAEQRRLPQLIELRDLQGCFHCHTNASDGSASLEEMVATAKNLGLRYFGIADHSQAAFYANGLSPERVRQQHARIDELNAKDPTIKIFKGIESDILADGSLDYDEETLSSFDYVVASIHQPMNMDEATMTDRVVRAMRHPRCTMLGHPTGRLLLQRDGFPLDVERILQVALETGVLIEINANPRRQDLDWVFCKRAKALGVSLVINPDAHATDGIADVQYGINTARKGWLEKSNVFNTRNRSEVEAFLTNRLANGP